jgi:hypothetical protein
MQRTDGLLVVVSRIGLHEDDFFRRWNAGPGPSDPPYAIYLDWNGSKCQPEDAEVALVRGDRDDIPTRVIQTVRDHRNADSAFLLVHTGGGDELADKLEGKSVPPDGTDVWAKLGRRSFWLMTDHVLYSFVRGELANYAAKQQQMFHNALSFLYKALNHALVLHPGGVDQSRPRSEEARIYLLDSANRKEAGLPILPPPRPRRNPVAAIIHDVVSRFDSLLIDMQTGADEAEYWQEIRGQYKGSIQKHVAHLNGILMESTSDVLELLSIAQIVKEITQHGSLSEGDLDKLREITIKLKDLAPAKKNRYVFNLIESIDKGEQNDIARLDIEEMRAWLESLRKTLGLLDGLYKAHSNRES